MPPHGGAPVVVAPRRENVLYDVDHYSGGGSGGSGGGGTLVIRTNADGATNFKVVAAPLATPGADHWRDVVPTSEDMSVRASRGVNNHLPASLHCALTLPAVRRS